MFNCQSVRNKKEEIENFTNHANIDILCLNETWLTKMDKFTIRNFETLRLDRKSGNSGGGVSICIKNSIKFERIDLDLNEEIIAVKILSSQIDPALNNDFILVTFYNPPNSVICAEILSKLAKLGQKVLIMGDLNAHSPTWKSKRYNTSGKIVEEFLIEEGFILLNRDEPTYQPIHRPDYNAIIDLALASTDMMDLVKSFFTSDFICSDHVPIFVDITNSDFKPTKYWKEIKKIDYALLKKTSLLKAHTLVGRKLVEPRDIDQYCDELTNIITSTVEKSTKIKRVRLNTQACYVLPKYILDLIGQKRKARKMYQITNGKNQHELGRQFKTEYNRLTDLIKKEIIKYKSNSWKNFCTSLNNHKVSDGVLWKKLGSIENSKSKTSSKTPKLKIEEKFLHTEKEVSEAFSDHLFHIFNDKDGNNFDNDFKQKVDEKIPELFKNNPTQVELTSPEEINEILKNIRGKGAPGIDKITNKVLKQLPTCYHTFIANLINASISQSYIPESWKLAVVTMIPKPMKDHTDVQNYRPISLLNTLSKIMERVIQKRLYNWLCHAKILSEFQCGFRRFRQTRDQILRLLLAAFNRNQKLGAIFIDIEKAFDKVWHSGLLFKLDKMRIPDILGKWLKNYLYKRCLMVRVGGFLSTKKLIENGVPQGSVLGPLLFNLFFNDITEVDSQMDKALFADDIAAWSTSNLTSVIKLRLQRFLNSIYSWMFKWRLKISTIKTVSCVFNKACLNYELGLTYNGEPISSERNPKFLGITLDPGLRLHKYAENLRQRSVKRLNMLRSIGGLKWGVSPATKIVTYKTLIRSLIDYAPFTPLIMYEANRQILERIQLKALRHSYNLPQNSTAKEVYDRAEMEKVFERSEMLSINYLIKAKLTNSLISSLIDSYIKHEELDEGILCKNNPRKTILGVLKEVANKNSKSMSIFA